MISHRLLGAIYLALSIAMIAWDILMAGRIANLRRIPRAFQMITGIGGLLIVPALVVAYTSQSLLYGRAIILVDWLWPFTALLFVVQTDGQENTSKEWNSTTIKDLIKSKENLNHWTFVYLGMGPQGWAELEKVSYGTQSVGNNMKFTGATSKKAYQNMAKATRKYSRAGGQGVNCVSMSFFSDAGVDKDQTK